MAEQTPKQVVPVVCATRDFQGAVAYSIATIWNTLWMMGKEPVYVQFPAHGYAFVRANAFRGLKQEFGGAEMVRGLLIDDDILIKDQMRLMQAIATADQNDWNFISPYRVRDGYVAIAHENGQLFTVEETRELKTWDRVPNAGLGFYYGWLPLNYQFHEDGAFGGEDLNFFWDNTWLEPRYVDLGLKHLKVMDIDLDTPIRVGKRPPSKVRPAPRENPPLDEEGQKRRIKE